ncbi:glycoside hydrolase family 17 protein [Piloderma croceum F 1598]|uniref:glucan endo-1,3-beta-D-glucosidase n=1 Tax=Piloderma croceum (strain F 1598) TaxID=765440 RepID=A0A0C3BCX4_PILCF|nr:glycoside hydrolase family 17 protein [Piloderma croceum F 1598]
MAPSGPNYYEYGWTQDNRWLEKQEAATKRSKRVVIGVLLALLALIGIAVGVGVGISQSHKSSSSSLDAIPSDPSKFDKDPDLFRSFYGLAYTPEGSQLPDCGANLSDVIKDIQLMSQLTTRIRLYGADCNQTSLVMDAIQQTKVNMTVYIGNYPVSTDNNTAYLRQRDEIDIAIKAFGVNNIGGVTVGNEFMLNYMTAQGTSDPNSAIANQGAQLLIADIDDTRSNLTSLDLPKELSVGTSDAGSYFNNEVMEKIDYMMCNVHAWFADQTIEQAAGWVSNFFQTVNVAEAANTTRKPQPLIAETGWPTGSANASLGFNGAANATEDNLQIFLNTFVCAANANGTGYFFFEYFDEPWKTAAFGGVEGYWGLFYSNRTLKNIKIPTCVLD